MNNAPRSLRLGSVILMVGIAVAVGLLLLPKAYASRATPIGPGQAGLAQVSADEGPDRSGPSEEDVFFCEDIALDEGAIATIRYDGELPPAELVAALRALQARGRVLAFERTEPNTLVAWGEEAALRLLDGLAGVTVIQSIEALPSPAMWPSDQACSGDSAIPADPTVSLIAQTPARPTGTGTITGVVTLEGAGTPLTDLTVSVYSATTYSFVDSAYPDSSGVFVVQGLDAGSYKLAFSPWFDQYVDEWYDNKFSWYGADPIVVTDGLSHIDAALSLAGSISGTVTASDGGPLDNVAVEVYTLDNPWWARYSDVTDSSGKYSVAGLAPGGYKVRFSDQSGAYLVEYFDSQPDLNAADVVSVTGGMTTTVDAALVAGGRIGGRVVDGATGMGVADVRVNVQQSGGSSSAHAYTDASGYYTTTALPSGVYSVGFFPPIPYLDEYYDNFDRESNSTLVIIDAPTTTANINAALAKGHMVTGTVTGAGIPLPDVDVLLYEGRDSYPSWDLSEYTVGDGTYAVGPLTSGEYRLAFMPPADSSYAMQWYDGAATYAGSSAVTVPHLAPIDVDLQHGSRITGVVTGLDGHPVEGAYIGVYEAGTRKSITDWTEATGARGQYASRGLAPGRYQVWFGQLLNSGLAGQWYDGQTTQADATMVTVTAGVTTTNINAQLSAAGTGSIVGSVTAMDTGKPVGVRICLYQDDLQDMFCGGWASGGWATDGTFTISGWAEGEYHLYFDAPAPYASVFYKDAYRPEDATAITITANMTTTGVDQVLRIGGSITGTVTAAGSGIGLAGTMVEVTPASPVHRVMGGGDSWDRIEIRTAYALADGTYRVDGLPAGSYDMRFVPPSPYLRAEYNLVSVAWGEVTPDIDVALSEGGVITGVITSVDTGELLLYTNAASAVVYNAAEEAVVTATADMDGRYTTPGLPAGTYKVRFSAGSSYLPEWNGDATSFETASFVTVPATGTVANVNAVLDRGGTFSGLICDAATDLPLPWAKVQLYTATTATSLGTAAANAWGFYQTSGLAAGQYKAAFSETDYATRWYDDAASIESATPITVNLAHDTPDINGCLYPAAQHPIFLALVLRNY